MSDIDLTGGSPLCPTCGKRYPYFDPREFVGKPCFDCEERAKQPTLFEVHAPATADQAETPPAAPLVGAPQSRAAIDAAMAKGAIAGLPPASVYREHAKAARKERARLASAKDRILARLREGPVTNIEMNETICYRYGSRIDELRRAGFRIDKDHVEGGVWRYTLVGDLPEGREETTASDDAGVAR